MSDRTEEARSALEALFIEYADVFASDTDGVEVRMPSLGAWVILVTFEDIQDPSIGATYFMSRKHQWAHETVGLLELRLQELTRRE